MTATNLGETKETSPPMLQFLQWVAAAERTYEETMDAWQTSCPRFSIWEDASIGGLVRLERDDPSHDANVRLTPRGRSLL